MPDPLDDTFRTLSPEFQLLRFEAIETLEECLTKGDGTEFMAFLEAQLAHVPPHLDLLRDIADELHLRLLRLREQQLDTGQQISAALREQYAIDLTTLGLSAQPELFQQLQRDEHLAEADNQSMTSLAEEFPPLGKAVQALLKMAHQLATDIQIAEELYQTVVDWWMALSISASRDLIGLQTLAGHSGDTGRLH